MTRHELNDHFNVMAFTAWMAPTMFTPASMRLKLLQVAHELMQWCLLSWMQIPRLAVSESLLPKNRLVLTATTTTQPQVSNQRRARMVAMGSCEVKEAVLRSHTGPRNRRNMSLGLWWNISSSVSSTDLTHSFNA